uniref:V-type ATP synthase subunit C n=1 Tax=Dictyoglomus thermophilum TaxID=14 RepID=A0A7V3ZI12_DICTH
MYTEYLFLSTNLKAKLPKLLDKRQWEILLNADLSDAYNLLKETIYAPLLEGYSGFLKVLYDDLKIMANTVKYPYWDLVLFEFMTHDVRNELLQLSKSESLEVFFNFSYGRTYSELRNKLTSKIQKADSQQISDLGLWNLIIDFGILATSKELFKRIENKKIRDFVLLKNKLNFIKIDVRLEKVPYVTEILKRLNWDLASYRVLYGDEELKQRFLEDLKNYDFDMLIKKYLYSYMNKNFKNVVSGPEVVLYYFYVKMWEMEDILFILENKKLKIPREYWERGLLRANE